VDDTKAREELILMISPQVIDADEGGAAAAKKLLEDNDVNGLETMATGQHIHELLRDHLPAPLPPPAQAVETPEQAAPKKRGLLDWLRRNKPAP
jgi:hypothetical protein